jgi:hypothetical protein
MADRIAPDMQHCDALGLKRQGLSTWIRQLLPGNRLPSRQRSIDRAPAPAPALGQRLEEVPRTVHPTAHVVQDRAQRLGERQVDLPVDLRLADARPFAHSTRLSTVRTLSVVVSVRPSQA